MIPRLKNELETGELKYNPRGGAAKVGGVQFFVLSEVKVSN
jgi:hypothetical protein